jgi:hypothetical protein
MGSSSLSWATSIGISTRARGYRNTTTFVTIIYLLAAPLPDILKST